MISNLPPVTAAKEAVFVHDYFNSFASTLFIGNELRLFSYEALFFCVVDMSLQNVSIQTDSIRVLYYCLCCIRQILLWWSYCSNVGDKYCLDYVRRLLISVLDPSTHGREQLVTKVSYWSALLDLEIVNDHLWIALHDKPSYLGTCEIYSK